MLTVKWLSENGSEQLLETREVNYSPEIPAVSFYFNDSGGGQSHVIYNNGRVFIMNDNGSTISTYYLD